MISKDNENSDLEFDLIDRIRSTEIEIMKSALIKANGDPYVVAKNWGVDVSYVFIKTRELDLEEYIKTNI